MKKTKNLEYTILYMFLQFLSRLFDCKFCAELGVVKVRARRWHSWYLNGRGIYTIYFLVLSQHNILNRIQTPQGVYTKQTKHKHYEHYISLS